MDQISNVIRLIVFLNTGKWVNSYFSRFCFFRIWFWTWQHDLFHMKIDKYRFVFKESYFLWVFSPQIWNVLWMGFSLKNLLYHLKKWRDDPEINKKLFFCFIFGLNMSKHMGLSFKSLLKGLMFKMPYGSVVSRRFYKYQLKNI